MVSQMILNGCIILPVESEALAGQIPSRLCNSNVNRLQQASEKQISYGTGQPVSQNISDLRKNNNGFLANLDSFAPNIFLCLAKLVDVV